MSKEEEKEERKGETFEKIMPKNFEKLKKDTNPQIKEAQRITNWKSVNKIKQKTTAECIFSK